jgi:predicted negative regulator of RcsB-dependent stress response
MAYDHEEQEQLATIKAWWARYGNLITWSLTIVLAAAAAWMYWDSQQRGKVAQAAQLYDELQKSVAAKDNVKVQRAATDMQTKFSKTAYAQMGAMAAAKAGFDANDLKAAKAELQWVIDNGSTDEYKAVAKIRLAGVLMDEKAYDEGLKLLASDFPPAFAGSVADRKGDILVAQNKVDEARAAYQTALDKTDKKMAARQLIQFKFDALGGSVAKTVG